ncbi:hypothetical protein F9949_17255, partial [Bacteroides stercoris]
MKKINLLLFFLLLACALPAQDGISVFIGRANRYASVELSDYRKRLCLEYNLKSATKLFSVLLASKRPLITELADK